jgi:mRNA interferase MazF
MIKNKIVLVAFPFDDFSGSKVRPAVCLTEPIGAHQHTVLAFITSRVPSDPLQTDLILDSSHQAFTATGLRVPSAVQLHRLVTVSTSVIQRELGVLTSDLQAEVRTRLRYLFDLD